MSGLTIKIVNELCLKYAKMITRDIKHYDTNVEIPDVKELAMRINELLEDELA